VVTDEGVSGNHRGKALAVGGHIGPWTYQAHRSPQNIEELRQLVEVRAAQPGTQPCDPEVGAGHGLPIGLFIDDHAPQLETGEQSPTLPHPLLYKKYRSSRTQLDEQGKDGQQPAQDADDDKRGY
jgi:hypothetical protein